MNKIALFFFTILFFNIHAVEAQNKIYVGLKGGYNFSTAYFFHSFNGSDIRTRFKGGVQAGLIVMHYFRDHVGIQAEINYTQKGWMQKFTNGQPNFKTTLNYLEIPLLVNINTGKSNIHFFANAGCFFEFLTGVKQSELPSDTEGQEFYPFVESRDKKFGYGYRAGAGMFYNFHFGTLMLESGVSYSMSNMINNGSVATNLPNTSNNIVIGIAVSYLFSFGKL